MTTVSRREWMKRGVAVGTAAALGPLVYSADQGAPSERVRVAVMGVSRNANGGNGRGCELAISFAGLPGVEVAYVCDVDAHHLAKAAEVVTSKQANAPKAVKDFRLILDDKSVDALVIATPDHWHAPATIFGCAAGKHVYVEKPCSHNPREGEWMLEAARKHKRVVQMGSQRRTWPGVRDGIARVHAGEIGRVIAARCYYFSNRVSIGKGERAKPPENLDFELWQGPAPERPYQTNLVPYNWHWFWHWGTGECGNNGVHYIDVARWGLQVDHCTSATSAGGKYRFPADDDQQTPDTHFVSFDFPDRKVITWEGRSWAKKTPVDPMDDILFVGEKGMLGIRAGGHVLYDANGKEVDKKTGPAGNDGHTQNFCDAIRGKAKLNAEIEEGVKSTLLCHLGNIACRTGTTVRCDAATGRPAENAEAMKLWGREYRAGWEPKV